MSAGNCTRENTTASAKSDHDGHAADTWWRVHAVLRSGAGQVSRIDGAVPASGHYQHQRYRERSEKATSNVVINFYLKRAAMIAGAILPCH